MRRILIRWAAPLLLAVVGWPGLAVAQTGGGDKVTVDREARDVKPDLPSGPPPALAYAVGVLLVLGVLVLICMPSRKPESYNTR
jgi:hypothetical protein